MARAAEQSALAEQNDMKSVLEIENDSKTEMQSPGEDWRDAVGRYVPLIVPIIVLGTVLLSTMKIVSYGYLPWDDALRHAAKAVSGKPWNEILVMRPEFIIDHNFGWHQLLAVLHSAFNWGPDVLVTFSVSALLILFCVTPLPWIRRPEAWLIVLFGAGLYGNLERMALGRPFILTCSVLLILLMLWQSETRAGIGKLIATTLLIAAAVWIHGTWYLFALPVFAFLLAGRWRATIELLACWLAGTLIGASMTGHPIQFTVQAIRILISCFGYHTLQRMLAIEFQPSDGAISAVLAVVLMLFFRKTRGLDCQQSLRSPVFILAALGWLLGLSVKRFWEDWGAPALFLWLALEAQEYFESACSRTSIARLGASAAAALGLYFAITSDSQNRWTHNLMDEYLVADNPELGGWLPERGGILYAADMGIFYQTFFKNPNAEWRYILGFEPTFMPEEDLRIYRNIQWNLGDPKAYRPWLKQMKPEDRMAIRKAGSNPPDIKDLEWHYGAAAIWLGRLPRSPEAAR
jgi:hypothetical protein